MADVVTKYCNIIWSILKSLDSKDFATEFQQWNLRSVIESILSPLNLEPATIDKIHTWVNKILAMISFGLAIAAPIQQLYNLIMNARNGLPISQ